MQTAPIDGDLHCHGHDGLVNSLTNVVLDGCYVGRFRCSFNYVYPGVHIPVGHTLHLESVWMLGRLRQT